MMRRDDRPVPGFAIGDDRADRLRAALRTVLREVQQFTRDLTAREEAILRLGLEASHMEESVVRGEWTRAEAHAESIVKLFDQLRSPS